MRAPKAPANLWIVLWWSASTSLSGLAAGLRAALADALAAPARLLQHVEGAEIGLVVEGVHVLLALEKTDHGIGCRRHQHLIGARLLFGIAEPCCQMTAVQREHAPNIARQSYVGD